jgi:transposase
MENYGQKFSIWQTKSLVVMVLGSSMGARGGVAMSDLIWLSEAQKRRIELYFPLSHGVPLVDNCRVISGIIFVIRNGLRWRDAPVAYGPPKTIYNRFIRWSRMGVFNKIFAALAAKGGKPEQLIIDATHLKAHRTAASLLKRGPYPKRIGRTKGGLNSRLHAVCVGKGPPLIMLLSEGQMSDYKGAALTVKGQSQESDPPRDSALPPASQDQEDVRKTQGLETHPHTLRPMRRYLHVRLLHRRNRHLLAESTSPDPNIPLWPDAPIGRVCHCSLPRKFAVAKPAKSIRCPSATTKPPYSSALNPYCSG